MYARCGIIPLVTIRLGLGDDILRPSESCVTSNRIRKTIAKPEFVGILESTLSKARPLALDPVSLAAFFSLLIWLIKNLLSLIYLI